MSSPTTTIPETLGSGYGSDIDVFQATFLSILISLCIGGNLLVCITFCTVKSLKHVPGDYLIVSLAGADLLVTCFAMIPTLVTVLLRGEWIFGEEFCTIFQCINIIMSCSASILTLCAISVDRYLRIKYALHYDLMVTPVKIGVTILFIWALSALMAFGPIPIGWLEKHPYLCMMAVDDNYIYAYCCISFLIPCIVIFVMYFKIFRIARSHADHIRRQTISNIPKRRSPIYEKKAAFTLGITTGIFVLCWLPYFICLVFSEYIIMDMGVDWVFKIAHRLSWTNSCFNPIIYSIFNTQYRRAFKRVLTCRNQDPGSLSTSLRSS